MLSRAARRFDANASDCFPQAVFIRPSVLFGFGDCRRLASRLEQHDAGQYGEIDGRGEYCVGTGRDREERASTGSTTTRRSACRARSSARMFKPAQMIAGNDTDGSGSVLSPIATIASTTARSESDRACPLRRSPCDCVVTLPEHPVQDQAAGQDSPRQHQERDTERRQRSRISRSARRETTHATEPARTRPSPIVEPTTSYCRSHSATIALTIAKPLARSAMLRRLSSGFDLPAAVPSSSKYRCTSRSRCSDTEHHRPL